MKRLLSLILVIAMAIFSAGCNGGGGGEGGGSASALDNSNVTLLFDFGEMFAMNNTGQDVMLAKFIDFITMAKTCYAAHLYDLITSLDIKVTGSGMSDIIREIEITNPSSTFSVTLTAVPNGPDRRFYIELNDRNNWLLYSGYSDPIVVGGTGGEPQDITIKVCTDEPIEAEDYVEIGRERLESNELELAFIAFEIAVGLDEDHPVANFFRGFTRFLLLVQKDGSDAYAPSPDTAITSMLNFYLGEDIYASTIVPDIYNEDYDEDSDTFFNGVYDEDFDDWKKPSGLITDDGVDVIENVMLPEIDNVITDLAYADNDPDFSTTLTTDMHFGISDEIKVDAADVYILEAAAYGLKAYLNHILAYQLRTEIDSTGTRS